MSEFVNVTAVIVLMAIVVALLAMVVVMVVVAVLPVAVAAGCAYSCGRYSLLSPVLLLSLLLFPFVVVAFFVCCGQEDGPSLPLQAGWPLGLDKRLVTVALLPSFCGGAGGGRGRGGGHASIC